MTARRDRISHVRPRSSARSRSAESQHVKAPEPYRLRRYRGIDARRPKTSAPARLGLGAVVAVLAVAAFLVAGGGAAVIGSVLGSGFNGFVKAITITPNPTTNDIVATKSPIIVAPGNPFTNEVRTELDIVIPAEVAGNSEAKVRVYLALENLSPAPIADVAVGGTTRLSVLVDLTAGRNDFSATVIRSGAESELSPVVTYWLDQDPPAITLTQPADGATVDGPAVVLTGSSEPASDLVARNEANGASVTARTSAEGGFAMTLPLAAGPNGIRIDATDPAGNSGSLVISVLQGTGAMAAELTASAYRISVSAPPEAIELTVLVTDPTGAALAGASAFFTLQVPGLGPISNELVTGADGRATFTAALNGAISTGTGAGSVLVSHSQFGTATGKVTLSFTP